MKFYTFTLVFIFSLHLPCVISWFQFLNCFLIECSCWVKIVLSLYYRVIQCPGSWLGLWSYSLFCICNLILVVCDWSICIVQRTVFQHLSITLQHMPYFILFVNMKSMSLFIFHSDCITVGILNNDLTTASFAT